MRPIDMALPQNRERVERFSEIYGGRFDLLINPRSAPDGYCAATYAHGSGAPVRLAFRQVDFIEDYDPNGAYTHLIDLPPVGEHVAVTAGRLLPALGIAGNSQAPYIAIGRNEEARAQSALGNRRCVVFGIGAAEPYRVWPAENFAEVARYLVANEYSVVLLGAESERRLADELRRHIEDEIIDLVGLTTIEEAAAIIRQCVLFVGTNSGPMHLAAAVGTPVVELGWLGGDTLGFDYDRAFFPFNVESVRVSPASGLGFQRTLAGEAIRSITPNDVVAAVVSCLGKSQRMQR
jgi:ADP-heptose:LPS heptosyltransferase